MGLPVGARLGKYQIHASLGCGGMGEVYLAEDAILQRRVAIKVLHQTEVSVEIKRRRLLNEARAAARLEHPNICPVYEVGEEGSTPYIVMPFIEGETLAVRLCRTRLGFAAVVDLAIQVVGALDAAHRRGVVHRDIKPQNIMITSLGQVKLMDFGLAKLTEGALTVAAAAETAPQLTAPHAIVGTVAYMSPEQARGEPLDARTDLFSVGSTLFEAVSGRPPFVERTAADTLSAILLKPPPALNTLIDDVPAPFEAVLTRCLEKDKDRRYQSSAELLAALLAVKAGAGVRTGPPPASPIWRRDRRRVAATAGAAIIAAVASMLYLVSLPPSRQPVSALAVLPFANAAADPDAEYLSEGIAENLINNLARVPTLRVTSRTVAFRHRGRDGDALAIARELGVGAILSGRVVVKGERVVVSAELIDASDGRHIWGDQYDRLASDVIGIQEAIVREVSARIRPELSAREQDLVARRDTENPEAYQLYLRGRYHWSKLDPEGWQKATEYFQQAIEHDPAYARAYAGLADCFNLRGIFGLMPARDAFPRAKQAAARALEADARLAEAHTSMGIAAFYYDWDWTAAEQAMRRAIQLEPDYAYAHNFLGIFLAAMGRFDEALLESRKAEELNPLSTLEATNVGLVLYFARRLDEAEAQFHRALELDRNYFTAHFWLGNVLAQRARHRDAIRELEQALTLSGGQPIVVAALGYVHASSGNRRLASQMLERLEAAAEHQHVPAYFLALVHQQMGNTDQAFVWLDKAYQERSGWMARLKVEPWMDGLRKDPRFMSLLARVGHVR